MSACIDYIAIATDSATVLLIMTYSIGRDTRKQYSGQSYDLRALCQILTSMANNNLTMNTYESHMSSRRVHVCICVCVCGTLLSLQTISFLDDTRIVFT